MRQIVNAFVVGAHRALFQFNIWGKFGLRIFGGAFLLYALIVAWIYHARFDAYDKYVVNVELRARLMALSSPDGRSRSDISIALKDPYHVRETVLLSKRGELDWYAKLRADTLGRLRYALILAAVLSGMVLLVLLVFARRARRSRLLEITADINRRLSVRSRHLYSNAQHPPGLSGNPILLSETKMVESKMLDAADIQTNDGSTIPDTSNGAVPAGKDPKRTLSKRGYSGKPARQRPDRVASKKTVKPKKSHGKRAPEQAELDLPAPAAKPKRKNKSRSKTSNRKSPKPVIFEGLNWGQNKDQDTDQGKNQDGDR